MNAAQAGGARPESALDSESSDGDEFLLDLGDAAEA
eukprot:SAG22_NODE_13271_length_412_cov_0.789137_1_plen_35_part_01